MSTTPVESIASFSTGPSLDSVFESFALLKSQMEGMAAEISTTKSLLIDAHLTIGELRTNNKTLESEKDKLLEECTTLHLENNNLMAKALVDHQTNADKLYLNTTTQLKLRNAILEREKESLAAQLHASQSSHEYRRWEIRRLGLALGGANQVLKRLCESSKKYRITVSSPVFGGDLWTVLAIKNSSHHAVSDISYFAACGESKQEGTLDPESSSKVLSRIQRSLDRQSTCTWSSFGHSGAMMMSRHSSSSTSSSDESI